MNWLRHQLLHDADGGLSFQHALVQQTVYDGLPVWRRRLLHQRAAEALLRQRHANLGPVNASVAAHYAAAGDLVQAANEPAAHWMPGRITRFRCAGWRTGCCWKQSKTE